MRVAVVGHVEWVSFGVVDRVPRAGEIVNTTENWDEPAGGGAVAAVQLANLAGACDLFTAFGDDELGERSKRELSALGISVHASTRDEPTRRAMTMIDAGRERTIVTFGERLEPSGADPLPWELIEEADVAYVTAGDPAAFEAARRARLLVVTSRGLSSLQASGVAADVLVGSARDKDEVFEADSLAQRPGLIIRTEGLAGGSWEAGDERHRWKSPIADPDGEEPLPPSDAYGAGDSFSAGLAYGLAAGMEVPDAIRLAARCGAACASGRGPYTAQLTAADLESDG